MSKRYEPYAAAVLWGHKHIIAFQNPTPILHMALLSLILSARRASWTGTLTMGPRYAQTPLTEPSSPLVEALRKIHIFPFDGFLTIATFIGPQLMNNESYATTLSDPFMQGLDRASGLPSSSSASTGAPPGKRGWRPPGMCLKQGIPQIQGMGPRFGPHPLLPQFGWGLKYGPSLCMWYIQEFQFGGPY